MPTTQRPLPECGSSQPDAEFVESGWCWNFFSPLCGGIGVPCVRDRDGETCLACRGRRAGECPEPEE